MKKYLLPTIFIAVFLSFALCEEYVAHDEDLRLSTLKDKLDKNSGNLNQGAIFLNYKGEFIYDWSSEINIPTSEIPKDWKICKPGDVGATVSCDPKIANVSMAHYSSRCNSTGTGYNYSQCIIMDCDEGFSGKNCLIEE